MERKEAIEIVRKLYNESLFLKKDKEAMVTLIPELAENEDERIRKDIISLVIKWWESDGEVEAKFSSKNSMLTWLEKQGEQKPTEVEPKLKAGDWVVTDWNNVVQIKAIEGSEYVLENRMRFSIDYVDKCWHLWAIQDAKDGDVLATEDWVFIFKELNAYGKPVCYCHYDDELGFKVDVNSYMATGSEIYPATKEQRDLLFQKMKEYGYEWDADKKELKEVEKKPVNIDYISGIRKELLGIEDNAKNINGLTESQWVAIRAAHRLLGECITKEQKPIKWSEEDKMQLDAAIHLVNSTGHIETANWLKGLKNRVQPQPKQEWSEEDESMLTRCIGALGKCYMGQLPTTVVDEIEWLRTKFKSLRPQSHWRPSDEQMMALRRTKAAIAGESGMYEPLNLLYEDLKKLREK